MKRITILFAAVLVIVALWGGGWLFAAGLIGRTLAEAATPADPEMAALSCGSSSVTGFPFRFDVTCSEAALSQGDVTIALPQIKATALVYRPTHFLAFAEGPARYSDAFYGTQQELRWQNLEASLRLNGWRLARFSLEAEDVAFLDTLLGDTVIFQSPHAEAHLLDIPDRHDAENGTADLALFIKAENAGLPLHSITGAQLTAESEITRVPDDIRLYGDPALLRFWQAGGGALTISEISADDATSAITIKGDLALNEAGQPQGSITITSRNVADRFGGLLDPQMRTLFFGAQQPDGGNLQNVTIINGTVFTGLLPMGTIPPLF